MMASFTTILVQFCLGYACVTVALFVMSLLGLRAAGFAARVMAGYVALLVASFFGIWAAIAFRLAGEAASGQWASGRAFKWLMFLLTGVMFTIEDPHRYLDTTRPAVFVGNHQTELDVLMLGTIFPRNCSVTAKKSIRYIPVLGWFMALSGSIFIDRKNAQDARQAMAGAVAEMRRKNQSVYIFPEGTRSYSKEPTLLPFKKGAFHLAVQGGVPIVPVVVANYSHIFWIKGLLFRSGYITCKVLDPIPTQGLTTADVDDLTRKTRNLMLEEITSLTRKTRGLEVSVPGIEEFTDQAIKASGSDAKTGPIRGVGGNMI